MWAAIAWLWFWGVVNFWVDLRREDARIPLVVFMTFLWPLTVPAAFIASRFPR